jgi:hypothetical protein
MERIEVRKDTADKMGLGTRDNMMVERRGGGCYF